MKNTDADVVIGNFSACNFIQIILEVGFHMH